MELKKLKDNARLPKTADEISALNDESRRIGVSLPFECNKAADAIRAAFVPNGYEVEIFVADGDAAKQYTQIEAILNADYEAVIVWPVDGNALDNINAQGSDIPVIAFYDLINNCDAVRYFVGVNFREIGNQQAEYIGEALANSQDEGTHNVVMIAGPGYNSNIMEIYNGAMETFDNYGIEILNGTPIILNDESQEAAYNAMRDFLNDNSGENISAICCCIDTYAEGVIEALCDGEYNETDMPIITSFGDSDKTMQNVLNGLQSMTIIVDYNEMAEDVFNALTNIFNGAEPDSNGTVDNGSTDVPTFYINGAIYESEGPTDPSFPVLESIEIITKPNKIVYFKDEFLNRTGIKVRANYTNGTNRIVSNGSLKFTPNYANFKSGKTDARIEVSYTEYGITKYDTFTVYKQTGVQLNNCDVSQNMGASGTGSVNLSSGQITYIFEDFAGTDSNMPINIARVYKKGFKQNRYVGKNWRLNLQQEITSKNGHYIYTDKEGKEYTFDNSYSTDDGRSSIRNEKLGLDLFNDNASTIRLVDRGNNTLVFGKEEKETVYKLTAMHQYPSSPSHEINAYSMKIDYDGNGKISTVTAGTVDKKRPKAIFNYKTDGYLDSIEYQIGTDNKVTVVQYTYNSSGFLTSIKRLNNNITEEFSAETCFTEEENKYFKVIDRTSKYGQNIYKTLTYTYATNGRVSQYSIGYGNNNEAFNVSYANIVDEDASKEYNDVIASTYITHDNTISVVSFNSYDTVAQYSYEKENGEDNYNKPKKVNSASSQAFNYKALANLYSDTLDIYHSDFASGKGDWKFGTVDSAYSISGGSSLRGKTLEKSFTFNDLQSDGETLFLSLWAYSNADFTATVKITGDSGTGEVIRKFTNALNGKWQFTAFPLGRIKNNETITITVGGNSTVYIDDVRITKAPYEVPDNIPETVLNNFGNAEKTYQYSPVDQKIACTEYKYDKGEQITEESVTIDNSLHSSTVYEYNSVGLLTSQKNYGKVKLKFIEQSYGYTGYKQTSYYDENNCKTEYSEGVNFTQSEIIGETNSPTATVDNTYYGISNFLKKVSSGNCQNEMTYATDGSIKNAKSGTDINFVYDTFGNVKAVKIGSTPLETYNYDWKHLNSITYANGTTISYTYDNNDRVTQITESGITPVTIAYSDDAEDKVTITNSNGAIYEGKTLNNGGVTGEYIVKFPSVSRMLKVQGCALNGARNVSTVKTYFGNETTPFESCVTTTDRDGLVTKLERSGHGASSTYSYDDLYRLTEKATKYNVSNIFTVTYEYNTVSGNRVTSRVESESLRVGLTQKDNYSYTYYNNGNLKEIKSGTTLKVKYEYDEYNRLTRENNYGLGYSYVYGYNTNGNITKKERYNITNGVISGTASKTDNYTYSTGSWKDQLKYYNGSEITYDASGNPLNYRGKTLQWCGRKLIKAGDIAMAYDFNGLRLSKGSKIYYWQGQNLKAECWGSNYIYYYYDESGVSGMNYNGTDYFYRKNVLGDVISILDSNGEVVVYYEYDAWGNYTVSGSNTSLGNLNPIRYRGYYYDTEFGLYYLQSRYYDPELGRFISADSVSYINPETIFGLNLYAYCGNNPVMNIDPTGKFDGFGFQFWASLIMYIGFAVASIFDDEIREDMNRINWNPFNSDEELVLKSSKVSFYRGAPIIRTDGDRSGTFLIILLTYETNYRSDRIDIVKHEYGHIVQQTMMNPVSYLLYVGIPSWSKMGNYKPYYAAPWETAADYFGGANTGDHNHSQEAIIKGLAHLLVANLAGPFSYLFAIH